MKRIRQIIIALISAQVAGFSALVSGRAQEEGVPDFNTALKSSEMIFPVDEGSTQKETQSAILLKDLELKRSRYARALELYCEGIKAFKDVEQSRADYEKVQILLAARQNKVKQVLALMDRQRAAIKDLRDTVHLYAHLNAHDRGSAM